MSYKRVQFLCSVVCDKTIRNKKKYDTSKHSNRYERLNFSSLHSSLRRLNTKSLSENISTQIIIHKRSKLLHFQEYSASADQHSILTYKRSTTQKPNLQTVKDKNAAKLVFNYSCYAKGKKRAELAAWTEYG